MRKCTKCQRELPLGNFYKKGNAFRSQCKDCMLEVTKKYYKDNRETILAQKKVWGDQRCETTGLTNRAKHSLKVRYGLEVEEYFQLLDSANNRCEICGVGINLCVDHNHLNGTIRGILCQKCNKALGGFGDSSELLSNALKYIQERGSYAERRK